jgi:hypothetical protein
LVARPLEPKEEQLHGYTATRKYFAEHAFVAESLDEDISGDEEPLTLSEALGTLKGSTDIMSRVDAENFGLEYGTTYGRAAEVMKERLSSPVSV